jgi:hypothetical protein
MPHCPPRLGARSCPARDRRLGIYCQCRGGGIGDASPFSVDNPFIADGLTAAKQDQDHTSSQAAKDEREQSR